MIPPVLHAENVAKEAHVVGLLPDIRDRPI
jgi:hypothetical protein